MFSGSILFGDYVPLISLGTIIRTVEVSINLIFDNSLTELLINSEVSAKKQKILPWHRTIRHEYNYCSVITRHAAESWHG